jgi:RND superfamily putative drug exporter
MAAGLLATVGRWCFRRRWQVLAMWVVLAAVGGLASARVSDSLTDSGIPHHVESMRAHDVLDAAAGSSAELIGMVDGVDPAASAVRDRVTSAAQELAGRPEVSRVLGPYSAGPAPSTAGQYVSGDGRAFLVLVVLEEMEQPDRDAAIDAVTAQLHRLGEELRRSGQPQATVRVGGEEAFTRQAILAEEEDLGRGELVSLPITLVVLVIVFGGLVAAGVPILAAVVTVAAAMLVLLGFAAVTELDSNVVTVVTVLGLALSIDYALLLVARCREELSAGVPLDVAVGRAWATAGRTVMFSALTVAAAISGLLVFDLPGLSALGAAGVSVALVAVLVALTFTAAVLGLTRRWIRPSTRGRTQRGDDAGFFAGLARLVQRRPVLVASTTTALLLLAGTPLLTTHIKLPGLVLMPPGTEARQVAEQLTSRFARTQTPAVAVVARTTATQLDEWAARWKDDSAVLRVHQAEQVGPEVARVDIDVFGDSQSESAQDLVRRVRADQPAGVRSWVTGDAAVLVDLLASIKRDLPWAIGVMVVAMVALLFAMTGSVVVPIKAVLASVVSLGATFGVMSAIFDRGWLSGPLDTLTVGGLDPFILVIVFAFAFGLSVDYEVFLLGRIKEEVERGYDTDTAVRRGLQRSGRVVTSAALVMVIVFASFAGAKMGEIEQIGVGLTVAVLVDATIVRCLLVPATMTLLGRLNWWAPRSLRRLHDRLGLGERPPPEREPAAVAKG